MNTATFSSCGFSLDSILQLFLMFRVLNDMLCFFDYNARIVMRGSNVSYRIDERF